jgi:O-methyltransferase
LGDLSDLSKIRAEYKQRGYALIKYDDGPVHSYPYDAPWLTDQSFRRLYDSIRDHTLVDRPRCYSLYLLMQQIAGLPGSVLEVGAWRGGTAGLLAACNVEKTLFIADTFVGVVKSSEWEHYRDNAHSDTSAALVTELLHKKLGLKNFQILEGIFPEESGHLVEGQTFAFVHLDVDVYLSTRDAFNFVWDKVVSHGIVAFDDYGMISACRGISKFVDEIRGDPDKIFVPNLNGQAYIIKSQPSPGCATHSDPGSSVVSENSTPNSAP